MDTTQLQCRKRSGKCGHQGQEGRRQHPKSLLPSSNSWGICRKYEKSAPSSHRVLVTWRIRKLFGWTKDEKRKTLQPTNLPDNIELAPEYIMRLIKCGCKSATPCSTRACNWTTDKLKCTIFCACYCRGCCQKKADYYEYNFLTIFKGLSMNTPFLSILNSWSNILPVLNMFFFESLDPKTYV